nr:hypothetical protein [Tanacetum cinerariifolium]
MSRDVITVGSTMRISLLYRGEYSQWRERFMNYLEEQIDGEAMINSIQNGDQPLPVIAQVSLAGNAQNAPLICKDYTENAKIHNETAKDLWDALERQMCSSEYGGQDRKAVILYEYETFKAIERELLLDTYLRYLQVINDLKKCGYKKDNCDVNDALGYKKKAVVVTSDPLALVAEKTKVSKQKVKVVVSSDSEGSGADDFSEEDYYFVAKAFNRRIFYSKPTNNNLRTSSISQSANKKQEFVKSDDKKEDKKADEKKRDMSKVKCYNCKKKGRFSKYCKKAKVKDYNYYKTKMLLAKKDSDEQVLLAEDQSWMASSSDFDQEINANMVSWLKLKRFFQNQTKVLHLPKKPLLRLQKKILEKETKISELKGCVSNKDVEIEKWLERLNECENKLHKIRRTNQTIHKIMPSKDTLYNGRKGIGFENPSYFEKAKDLRPSLYDENVIGLGYTSMFLIHSDEALEIEKFKRARKNKIEFAYDYGNQNASYVNEKINFSDDYFQEIINPDFEKIDSPFQQTSSLKPYVPNVILEKIIVDLEDKVVSLLEKEKANLKTIEYLKSKGFKSNENAISKSENQSENDYHVVEKECDKVENSKVIAPGLFKLNCLDLSLDHRLGCSKHMMGNRALLTNFVEKFLGTVCFGNNDFAMIVGYGDVGLEVAFRKSTCFVQKEDGVDFLTGDRSSNLYTISLNEVASNSLTCLLAKSSSLRSWLWHQRLSHLNFAIINNLVKNNLVQDLPKMKFEKDHLCSACEQGKIHRKHHKSKTAFASNKQLYLLHMDLYGLMRVESINGKLYVLAIVNDYSRYTWVFFLHSKDEAFEVIISFIKKTQVNLQLQVQRVRTDNGTEFKNKTLAKFFDAVGSTQQFSAARSPQQNGVVERRNRTLVEAARTMLTFAILKLFLWAAVITIVCFIQNHSIIHKRFDKIPYELMNKRKPNIKFFRVFGCRCYLLNDYEDVGKLKAKGDIEVFVGYLKESAAFRIYKKRTQPGLSNLNETGKSSNPSVSQVSETSKKYLEDLFHNFYDEYFDSSKIMKSSTTNVETSINEEVFHEVSESFQEKSSSSSLNDDIQQSSEEVGVPSLNTQSISNNMIHNVDEASTSHTVFNELLKDAYFDASTSFHDPSNVHTFYQPYPHEKKWTKDHPLHKIIGDPKSSVRTRGQLANSCLSSCLLSSIELANVAEALKDADWVSAMQDELDQFARLKVWRLVPRLEGKTVIKIKWIFKNKIDESIVRIKAIRLFLAYAVHKDFTVFQMNVKTTFLNGILKEEVYVGQPPGFVSKQYPDHVYALDKALYGLKLVPQAWNDVLSQFLIDSDFQKAIIFVGLEDLMGYFGGVCFGNKGENVWLLISISRTSKDILHLELKLKAYMDMMLFLHFQGGENKRFNRKRMQDHHEGIKYKLNKEYISLVFEYKRDEESSEHIWDNQETGKEIESRSD